MVLATETYSQRVWTDEKFASLLDWGNKYEIVNGELIDMENSGTQHGNKGKKT
jgi:Uma2 family endonuclease